MRFPHFLGKYFDTAEVLIAALLRTDQVQVLPQRFDQGRPAVQLQLASDTRCLCNHGSSLLRAVRSTRCAERPLKRCWTDARSDEEPVLNGRHPAGRPPSPDIRAEEHSLHRAG